MRRDKIICFFFFLVITISFIDMANAQKSITQKEYEGYKKELGFDKTNKVLRLKDFGLKQKPQQAPTMPRNFDFLAGTVKFIGYSAMVLIVVFLLYMIVKELSLKQKIKTANIDLDNIEDIKNIDFEKMLLDTLADKDYRLAIRIKFLMVIKSLTEQEIIEWKLYKTNRTYGNELKILDYKPGFLRLTNIFEHIWYGVSSIDEEKYQQYTPYFDSFLKTTRK